MNKPHLIEFLEIGQSDLGYLSIGDSNSLPFDPKRVFWTYHTPEKVVRGRHAHYDTEMIIIACAGSITVNTEMPDGTVDVFKLDRPNIGVYIPKLCWHTMIYSHTAVQLVIASTDYNEKDYIREYNEFKNK